jgi:hypothetical protein
MAVIGAAAMLAFAAIGTIASIGGNTTTAAYAQALGNGGHGTPRQDPGQPIIESTGEPDPNCWGDVSKQLAQRDDSQPGTGEHASSFGEPRLGVGNQAEDTPAEHGDVVGDMAQPEPINCIEG